MTTTFRKKSIFIFLALVFIATFVVVFAIGGGRSFTASAEILSNTTGTEVNDGLVDSYSTSASVVQGITSEAPNAGATLKAYYKDFGSGSTTRVANAYVQKVINISIDNDDIVAAAQNGRMSAKILISGTNDFVLGNGTQNISKSISYALSGSIASATSGDISSQASFEDYSISTGFLKLTPSQGSLDIILTATAVYHAETPGGGTGEVVAETSLNCELSSIKILFSFDDVEVTLTIAGNGKVVECVNTVDTEYTTTQSLSYTFGEVVSFEALPNANSTYFRGWSVGGTPQNTLAVDLPAVHNIPSNVNPTYTATFATFDVASNLSSFGHNNQTQGPKVTETNMTPFKTYHQYSGLDSAGTPFGPSTAKPVSAGDYTYKFELYFNVAGENGDKVGLIEKTFTIVKDKASLTPNQSIPYEINLGDALGDITFSVTAAHSITGAPVSGNWVFIEQPETELVGGQQVITVNTATLAATLDTDALINATTGKDLYYRFAPTGVFILNSSISWGKVTLVVHDAITNDSVNVNETTRVITITKTIVTEVDGNVLNNMGISAIVKEAVKISLRANFTDLTGKYFFIGWRFGENLGEDGYDYTYLTAGGSVFDSTGYGLSFDYYIPEWTTGSKTARNPLTTGSIQAVFVEDTSAGDEGSSLTKKYTGSSIVFSPSFNPNNNADFQFNWTAIEYYVGGSWVSTAPSAIGTYDARYNLRNADSAVGTYPVVGQRLLTLIISSTQIRAERKTAGTYNENIGWGTVLKYQLSSQGTVSGAVTSYYYSTNYNVNTPETTTWTLIDLLPAASSGCAVTYDLPMPAVEPGNSGGSSALNYTFMAVGPGGANVNYGGGGGIDYALVSISTTIMCKIDSYLPSVSSVEVGQYVDSVWVAYSGAPTKNPVYFRTYINYGGSGAQMEILNAGKTSLFNSYMPNAYFNSTSDATIHTAVYVEFQLNIEYSGDVYIKIKNGVNRVSIFKQGEPLVDAPFPVHIDFTPPSITFYSSTFSPNSNGWVNTESSFYYTVLDSGTSASGVEVSTYACVGASAVVPSIEGTIFNRMCEIKIKDNKTYYFSVTDRAGNNATLQIQENIDTEEVIFTVDPNGYNSGDWYNDIAVVNAEVTSGPSGIKYEYKSSAGSYVLWNPQESFVTPTYDVGRGKYVSESTFSIDPGASGLQDTYTIRISNMAFKVAADAKEYVFYVKLDKTLPTISMITNLVPYQGSAWTTSAVNLRFDVGDSAHTFNSGVDKVCIDDGSGQETITSMTGQPLQFQYSVVKCTQHLIYVYDFAGNIKTYSFVLKVDLGTPDISGVLYVGGANPQLPLEEPSASDNLPEKVYNYKNNSFYVTESNLEAWVRIEFLITATASGTLLQQSKDASTWVNVSQNFVPVGLAIESEFNIRLFFTEEQYTTYYYRLVTGGNRFTYMTDGQSSESGPAQGFSIRIDKTEPVLNQIFIVDRVEKDITTLWTTKNATWKFSLYEDPLKGSGIKQGSVKLYSWPYNIEDLEIEGQFEGAPEDFEGVFITLPSPVFGEYTYEVTVDSLKYAVCAEDNAGHRVVRLVFPMIDYTSNISISGIIATAKMLNGGVTLNEYSENLWLATDERVDFEIQTLFNTSSGGRASFGPSGGGVQFSVNGGVTWFDSFSIEGVSQTVNKGANGLYSMEVPSPQYYQYRFRAYTGAGYSSSFGTYYWVKKDNVDPQVTLSALYTAGIIVDQPYTGQWIDGSVKVNMLVTMGPSLGSVFYATRPLEGGEIGSYSLVKNLTRSDVIYNSETGKYKYQGLIDIRVTKNASYFVKIITKKDSETPGIYVDAVSDPGLDVRIDRDAISIEARGYKQISTTEELLSGDWSDENINIKTHILSKGPSDIVEVYISNYNGIDWSGYSLIGTSLDAAYLVSAGSYGTGQYRLRVVNETGKASVSPPFLSNIDKHKPIFTMSIVTSPLTFGTYAGWYTENVEILMQPTLHPEYGLDGYVASYYYKEHIDGEWVGPFDKATFSFYLNANGVVGGNNFDYRFTVRGRSGIEATYEEEYIPIDTTAYTYTINMFVGSVPDPRTLGVSVFATSLSGVSMTYLRGSNPEVGLVCANTYRIKKITEDFGGVQTDVVSEQSFASNITYYETSYITGINHVVWTVLLYKAIELEYLYTTQYKQAGSIVSIGYAPADSSFNNIFGSLNHLGSLTEGQIGIDITYTIGVLEPSSLIPQDLGVYDVNVSLRNSNLDIYITNPDNKFTVVYFSGSGTSLNPYSISSQMDFEIISQYMHYQDGYEINDPLLYLGENRRNAFFRQTGNFVVSRNMNPICNPGEGYIRDFMGNYDGNGYEISISETVNIYGNYALFERVSGVIENLGVRMNLKINSTLSEKSVGMIVSKITNGTIKNCYAIGSVSLEGNDVYFGGLVGYADNSLIAQSFVDVNITAIQATGMIGGAVGRLINNSFCEAVYSSGIIKVIGSDPYVNTAPIAEVLCFGNIAGYSGSLAAGIGPERENLYIVNNLAVDSLILGTLPVANIDAFIGLMMNAKTGFYFLEAAESIVEVPGREKSLGSLMSVNVGAKAAALGVTGQGVAESPFVIDSPAKFIMTERIPWGYYEQNGNITFSNEQRTYFAYDMPFTGVYDGKGYDIRNIKFFVEDIKYLGLFSVLKGTVKNLRLVGVEISAISDSDMFVGAISGFMLSGSVIDKVVLSGNISVESLFGKVYVGGIAGLVDYATVKNSLSLASVNVKASKHSVVGGLVAQAQGLSTISSLVSISTVVNNFENTGSTGRVVGIVISSGTTVLNLYSVSGSAYSNGKLASGLCAAFSVPIITGNIVGSYDLIAGASSTVSIGGILVKNLITGLYPFAEGNGTSDIPFRISSYNELLEIGNYMYANFVLTDNIIIGDINDDGEITSLDGYKYDFKPIGGGAAFTGYLDGTSSKIINGVPTLVKHYIIGLTDSLFEINAGRISNIGLSVNYKVYARYEDIPENEKFVIDGETYTPSKVALPGKDIYYGAVAKYNRATGNLRNVTVEGDIVIKLPGTRKAVVGALVGTDHGGNIVANIVEINMDIRSFVAEVGGVVGSIVSGDASLTYMYTQIVEGQIKVTAANSSVGVLVGTVKVFTDKPVPQIIPQCEIVVDNDILSSPSVYGRTFGTGG